MVEETPKDTPSDYATEQAQIRMLNEALPRRVTEADLAQHERPADRQEQQRELAVIEEDRLRMAEEMVQGTPHVMTPAEKKEKAQKTTGFPTARTRTSFEPRRGQFNE